MFYVLVYLVAIVAANLSVAYFGPQAVIVNAFLLIGRFALPVTTGRRCRALMSRLMPLT